jgi:acid stress-induced BolA-like protein IbaG/YrbA
MTPEQIQSMIEAQLPDCSASVSSDDNTHFAATVVTSAFEGKRLIQRHQMIYGALGDKMGGDIHALSIQAFTPQEWAERPR